MHNTAILLLAAGCSERFNGNKLLFPVNNSTTLLDLAVDKYQQHTEHLCIVISDNAQLIDHCASNNYPFTINHHAQQGMGSSIAHGVEQFENSSSCMIALADMPSILDSTISLLLHSHAHNQITVPCMATTEKISGYGHPVIFPQTLFDELQQLDSTYGARDMLQQHRELIKYIDVSDPGIFFDIDTQEDMQNFLSNEYR